MFLRFAQKGRTMTGNEISELGRTLSALQQTVAALQATMVAQTEASAEAHRFHTQRDDRLESKIDTLLRQDHEMVQRLSAVETTLRDGIMVANTIGKHAQTVSDTNSERLRLVEQSDANQIGRAAQNKEGVTNSIAVVSTAVAIILLFWTIFTYIIPGRG